MEQGGQETERKGPETDSSFKGVPSDISPSTGPQILAAHSSVNVSMLQSFCEVSNSWSSSLPAAPPPEDNTSNI